jgi:hypothetical protein
MADDPARSHPALAALLSADGQPDVAAIAALRARYDTEQLTPLVVPR